VIALTQSKRRFPPPWSVEEGDNYFVVSDREDQQLAYVHFDNLRAAAKPLTRDDARRITANVREVAGAIALDNRRNRRRAVPMPAYNFHLCRSLSIA
jgi:hypothetical protein